MSDIPIADIKALLQARCPGLIHELVPGCRREGALFSAPNPTRGKDTHGSFKIWPDGGWREFDEGEGGDILDLLAYVANHVPASKEGKRYALQRAREMLGLAHGDKAALAAVRKQADERRKRSDAEAERRRQWIVDKVRYIIKEARPCEASDRDALVVRYLLGRGIDPAQVVNRARPLLLHPGLTIWGQHNDSRWHGPALVSIISTPRNPHSAVQCLFLDERDGKVTTAPVATPKLMLGDAKGGVVPISNGATALSLAQAAVAGQVDPVILCEGVRTGEAIAGVVHDARVWSCLNLGNMANAPIGHRAVGQVILALENDIKPQALRQRQKVIAALAEHGKPLAFMQPHMGSDFADVIEEG